MQLPVVTVDEYRSLFYNGTGVADDDESREALEITCSVIMIAAVRGDSNMLQHLVEHLISEHGYLNAYAVSLWLCALVEKSKGWVANRVARADGKEAFVRVTFPYSPDEPGRDDKMEVTAIRYVAAWSNEDFDNSHALFANSIQRGEECDLYPNGVYQHNSGVCQLLRTLVSIALQSITRASQW